MKLLCAIGRHDWDVDTDVVDKGDACEDCGYGASATRKCRRCGKKQMMWHPANIREECYWTDAQEGIA